MNKKNKRQLHGRYVKSGDEHENENQDSTRRNGKSQARSEDLTSLLLNMDSGMNFLKNPISPFSRYTKLRAVSYPLKTVVGSPNC